jgi:hypothetical protein
VAKSTRELGLFVPPEKERELRELDELEAEQKTRIRRRLWFRWVGWGAVLAVLGQWSVGFLDFFTPKRLGAFGGTVIAGLVTDFKVGDVKVIREGKFYVTRVPVGFFALYWRIAIRRCPVRPTAAIRHSPTRVASNAHVTARSITATGRSSRALPRARWICSR